MGTDATQTDILVIASGLGGLAAAWNAANQGCEVTLLTRASNPEDSKTSLAQDGCELGKRSVRLLLRLEFFEFDLSSVGEDGGQRFVTNPRHYVLWRNSLTEPASNCRAPKLVIVHSDIRQIRSLRHPLHDAQQMCVDTTLGCRKHKVGALCTACLHALFKFLIEPRRHGHIAIGGLCLGIPFCAFIISFISTRQMFVAKLMSA